MLTTILPRKHEKPYINITEMFHSDLPMLADNSLFGAIIIWYFIYMYLF